MDKVVRIKAVEFAPEKADGYWEKYDDSEFCYCSCCGNPSAKDENVSWHKYCPVCGAKMDEEG